jgi:hypothetical protein
MKNIILIIVLCATHLSTKASDTILPNRIQQDSICVCKKDTTLKCCKKNTSTYYGNPNTLSPKEKMKYEVMQKGDCCTHNKKEKKDKNPCSNCKKEAVKN